MIITFLSGLLYNDHFFLSTNTTVRTLFNAEWRVEVEELALLLEERGEVQCVVEVSNGPQS